MKLRTILLATATNIPVPIDGNFVVIVSGIGVKIGVLEIDISSSTEGNYFLTHASAGLSDPIPFTIPWDENTMWVRQDSGGPTIFSYYSY